MAIKAGQILHVGGIGTGFLIDRIQTAGLTGLNIPEERIYELGNYQTVAVVRDTPDLTFELESYDVSTEVEALLLGLDPSTTVAGQEFDFSKSIPLDIISPFKDKGGAFTTVRGIAIPYLGLENVTYRFGVGQNSTEQFTLRGDSVFYVPGTPYTKQFTITAGANQVYAFGLTAMPYAEDENTLYALSACALNTTTGAYKRLFFGENYTNTTTNMTVLDNLSTAGYNRLFITFGSATVATYNQASHPSDSIKPAAVRAKDIDVYVSNGAATPVLVRWKGVQSFEVTRRVTLDRDEEFGNPRIVAQDYESADVNGSITIKPEDAEYLFSLVQQIANVATTSVAGPQTSVPLSLELRVSHPTTGARLKTIYVPDARFQVPTSSNRPQQKLTAQFNFASDSGVLKTYQGVRP